MLRIFLPIWWTLKFLASALGKVIMLPITVVGIVQKIVVLTIFAIVIAVAIYIAIIWDSIDIGFSARALAELPLW